MLPLAYCINLDSSESNMRRIVKDWSHLLNVERFSAVAASTATAVDARAACAKSHKELFKKLALRSEPFGIIMEDDVYPTKNFDRRLWDRIIWFANTQKGWDMIALDPILHFECKVVQKFNELFCSVNKFRSTGMILYSTEFVKRNLAFLTDFSGAIDMSVTHQESFLKLTPCKLIVRQYTDKPSSISKAATTTGYDKYWDKTEKILADCTKDSF